MLKLHLQLITSTNIYQQCSLTSLIIVTLVMLDWVVEGYIKKIQSFKRSWQVASNVHKNFFDCGFYPNSEISSSEVQDSGSSDKPNSFTHNFNDLHEIRLKNRNRLISVHIYINSKE